MERLRRPVSEEVTSYYSLVGAMPMLHYGPTMAKLDAHRKKIVTRGGKGPPYYCNRNKKKRERERKKPSNNSRVIIMIPVMLQVT